MLASVLPQNDIGRFGMIGSSQGMREVYRFIERVAPSSSTVLILGHSGTGKELAARALHENSVRANQAYVAVNCAALTETLLESELFGHVKGAFTGATADRKGRIEMAAGGTLFLDEIGELDLRLQAKLLRVLQQREFERVGSTQTIRVDIRLIAATNRDLRQEIQRGAFREDLYYRLNVLPVRMPALGERVEDIVPLAEYFLSQLSPLRKLHLSAELRLALQSWAWPGNVRELENAIERMVALSEGDVLHPHDLPEDMRRSPTAEVVSEHWRAGHMLADAEEAARQQAIRHALDRTGGHITHAAQLLGIHVTHLHRLLRKSGLRSPKH
jgi:transcriptional regulator with GAF, ATPase, and Fis domain